MGISPYTKILGNDTIIEGSKSSISNYRPISLLPPFLKLLERLYTKDYMII